MADSSPSDFPRHDRQFATTHWSLVLRAGEGTSAPAEAALAELCQRYWYPLYAFVRRKGFQPAEASDLTQAFFVSLLERHDFALADPRRGKFRSFLLAALNHFLSNQWRAARAHKRGAGVRAVSLEIDFADGERRYVHEPTHGETAERIFERRWALAMLEQALAALRAELAAGGKLRQFDVLRPFLVDAPATSYERAAEELEMTTVAVRVAVHRLREKYRRHLRALVAQTLDSADDVDRELVALLQAIRSD